jgi:hypothetical protein
MFVRRRRDAERRQMTFCGGVVVDRRVEVSWTLANAKMSLFDGEDLVTVHTKTRAETV